MLTQERMSCILFRVATNYDESEAKLIKENFKSVLIMTALVILVFKSAQFLSNLIYVHNSGTSLLLCLLILILACITIFEIIRYFVRKIIQHSHMGE